MRFTKTPLLAAASLLAFIAIPGIAADGVPDPGFGSQGMAFLTPDDVEAREIQPNATIVLPDGKLLFGGTRNKFNPAVPFEPEIRCALARLNADGSVDSSFGNTSIPGVVVLEGLVEGARMEGIESMKRLDDGSIIAVGVSMVNVPLRGFVVKLDESGNLDTTFGDGGAVFVPATYAHAVAIDSQGRIVVAGEHIQNQVYTSTVMRFLADGTPDDAFGDTGVVSIHWDSAGNSGYLADLALLDDDRIIVGGSYSIYGDGLGGDYAVARLDTLGGFDTTFADVGWRVFHDPANSSMVNAINRIALTPDGGIAFAGYYYTADSVTALLLGHLNGNGTTDTAFGDVATPGFFRPAILPTAQTMLPTALLAQADGKLAVSVSYFDANRQDFFALRTTAAGQLDPDFADGGVFDFDLAPDGVYSDLSSMALQPDGALILAGRSMQSTESPIVDLGVMRLLNGGGPPDRIFASGFDPESSQP